MSTTNLLTSSPRLHARVTGLVGAIMLVSGSFSAYVRAKLVVEGDVAATAQHLATSHLLFRSGLASGLLMMIAFAFYGLLLYGLLRSVHRFAAQAMLTLVLLSVPIFMLNQTNALAALTMAPQGAVQQVQLFLSLHKAGNLIAAIFFGLWLFPFGLLVYKSGFFPRVLGALLMLGSPGYLLLFVQGFFFPQSRLTLWSNAPLVVTHIAELSMMLWLLVRGLNLESFNERLVTASPDA